MPNLKMDLRGLVPPEPIEQILQWLDVAIVGENLVAHLPHTPYPLYDYLRTRSCHWECVAHADGSAILTLYRD